MLYLILVLYLYILLIYAFMLCLMVNRFVVILLQSRFTDREINRFVIRTQHKPDEYAKTICFYCKGSRF